MLNAAGGECLEDFAHLRQDGVRELIGHDLPSPEAARKFLYQFHDDQLMEQAQQRLLPGQISYIPEENTPLQGSGQVNAELVRELARRGEPQKMATIDLDSTVIESWKQEAQSTYQGGRGYQPMLALWAEMNLIVADEFRDGNLPAVQEPLRVARRAFQSLPETVTEYYFRGDSACYDKQLMNWLRNDQREGFARGRIRFAVSARMQASLKEHILRLPPRGREAVPGRSRGAERVRRRVELLAGSRGRQTVWAPAFRGDSDPQTARGVVRRRRRSQALRRSRQCVGVGSQTLAGVASREGRNQRGHS
jgi:hypothetical protein